MEETYLGKDLLRKPINVCSFLYGQQQFTESPTEPEIADDSDK